jgi:hypothetical protein
MQTITCPGCGQSVPLERLCKECGADLRELVKKAEEENIRRKEQRRQAEETRKRQLEEQERKQQEEQAQKERLERWEQQRKIRRKRNSIITTVLVIAAVAVTVFITYEKIRPDTWAPVSSNTEIAGTWQGRTVFDASEIDNIKLPSTNIIVEAVIDNLRDPENIHTIIKLDFSQFVETLAPHYDESSLPEENDLPAFLEKPYVELDAYASFSDLNQLGQLFINHRNTKLKWQLNLERLGMDGLNGIECILEKIGDAKTYKPGEAGEAGVVFYDKGSYSGGWRYLEVSLEPTRETIWSNGTVFITNLSTELGEGDINTRGIIEILGENTAAYVASSYRGGGKNDWYLGNNKEMLVCYENLVQKGGQRKKARKVSGYVDMKKGFWDTENTSYWTSEMQSADKAFAIDLEKHLFEKGGKIHAPDILPGKTLFNLEYLHDYPVRPIRKF